ncbi:MAG: hypothetical protein LUP91_11445, partial [Methylococcaceae bacterium]|nr:hypothetical protein [Methylococcaceae bacterium]
MDRLFKLPILPEQLLKRGLIAAPGGGPEQEAVEEAVGHDPLVSEDARPGCDCRQDVSPVIKAAGDVLQKPNPHRTVALSFRRAGNLGPPEDIAERQFEDVDVLTEPAGTVPPVHEQDDPVFPPVTW